MSILVFIQTNIGSTDIPKSSVAACNAALALKKKTSSAEPVIGLVFGSQEVAKAAAFTGFAKIIYIQE